MDAADRASAPAKASRRNEPDQGRPARALADRVRDQAGRRRAAPLPQGAQRLVLRPRRRGRVPRRRLGRPRVSGDVCPRPSGSRPLLQERQRASRRGALNLHTPGGFAHTVASSRLSMREARSRTPSSSSATMFSTSERRRISSHSRPERGSACSTAQGASRRASSTEHSPGLAQVSFHAEGMSNPRGRRPAMPAGRPRAVGDAPAAKEGVDGGTMGSVL